MPTLITCLQELVDMVHTLMVVSGDAVIAMSCGMGMYNWKETLVFLCILIAIGGKNYPKIKCLSKFPK